MGSSKVLILGSSSKARVKLLESIGICPDSIIRPDVDETPLKKEAPIPYAIRVADAKLQAAVELIKKNAADSCIIITADTIAACGKRLLNKSYDKEQIRKHIQLISGRRHKIFTSVCCGLIEDRKLKTVRKRTVESIIKFKRMQTDEIEFLLNSGQCEGNAGGYTVQGVCGRYVKFVSGSWSNIIGLPLYETTQMLKSCGYKL